MSLKKISLTFAEKLLLSNLLNTQTDATVATARNVREVRRRLELREAAKRIDKAREALQDYDFEISWDVLADHSDLLDALTKKLEAEQADQEKLHLTEVIKRLEQLLDSEPCEYTIDDAYLRWVQQQCDQKNWSKAKVMDANGLVREVEAIAHPSMLAVFADVADKVQAALAN